VRWLLVFKFGQDVCPISLEGANHCLSVVLSPEPQTKELGVEDLVQARNLAGLMLGMQPLKSMVAAVYLLFTIIVL